MTVTLKKAVKGKAKQKPGTKKGSKQPHKPNLRKSTIAKGKADPSGKELSLEPGTFAGKNGSLTKDVDPANIEKLAALYCTTEEIAGFCGISVATLYRRFQDPVFRDAYISGRAKGAVSLRRHQWKLAVAGNPQMLIWLGKQMLGQKDRNHVDVDFVGDLPALDTNDRMLVIPWDDDLQASFDAIDADFVDLKK